MWSRSPRGTCIASPIVSEGEEDIGRLFAISRLLFENDMLWGTTLSMQSVDLDVLAAGMEWNQVGSLFS